MLWTYREFILKKSRLLLIIVGLVIVGSAVFYYQSQRTPAEAVAEKGKPAEGAAAAGSSQVRYAANAPQLAFLQVMSAPALPEPLIEPLNARIAYDENFTSRVSSPIAGRIIKIMAQPGDVIKAGQPLLQINAPEYNSAVSDIAKSQADLRQKRGAYTRAKTLYEGEVLARKELESAQADLKQSEAENRRVRQRLSGLDRGFEGGADNYILRSTLNGVVAERKVNPGTEVRPDAPDPLFVITDPTHLWVIIDVPEKYINKLVIGQKVSVDVDAFQGEDFVGLVSSIGEVLDPATRRIQVRCTIDNRQRRLKPEMFARVTPIVNDSRKLVRIPNAAIITEGLYSFVFVEKETGLFERRRVTLGLQGREETYVKDGITEGERVVASGALLLNSELAGRN